MLRSTKNYWVLTCGEKEGGGLLTDLRCAAINLGAIPVLQWTHSCTGPNEGLTGSCGLCSKTCLSLSEPAGSKIRDGERSFASHVFHPFDVHQIKLFLNILHIFCNICFLFCFVFFKRIFKSFREFTPV